MGINIHNFIRILGFGQKRCGNCHTVFFPEQLSGATPFLCAECAQRLSIYAGRRCARCGLPIAEKESANPFFNKNQDKERICEECKKSPPPWNGLAYYGLYTETLRDMLLRFKFEAELNLAAIFGDFLCQACQCLPKPDFVTAIPQYPEKLRRRGYNQAYEIARAVCRKTGFRLNANLLKRIKAVAPQEGLGAMERRENLKNSFRAGPEVEGMRIWLVDDVLTTGATCAEAAETLRAAGAAAIYLLFAARTPRA